MIKGVVLVHKPMVLKEETEAELPQVRYWDGQIMFQYHGFWLSSYSFPGIFPFHKHFLSHPTDVVLASFPKSGTTWLKALAFCIINRTRHNDYDHTHPLLTSNPHHLVPFLEILYNSNNPPPLVVPPQHDLRLFATHLPYSLLAPSITQDSSKCRIIYICRNPLDQFISCFFFHLNIILQAPLLYSNDDDDERDPEVVADEYFDEAFDLFCRGEQPYGSLWRHALEYWKVSRERPDEVLFLKYEELKEDTVGWTKRVGEFMGCPFSPEEERQGVIQDIVKLCSFETMKDLDVNKNGKHVVGFGNSVFFRKGEVGDWANYLTRAMVDRVQTIVEEELVGSGLTFDFSKTAVT